MCNCKDRFYCRECGEMFCENHPCSCHIVACPNCNEEFEND